MMYYVCGSCGWDSRVLPLQHMGFCPQCHRDSLDIRECLTSLEVAKKLNMARKGVNHHIKEGHIRASMINGVNYISFEAFREYRERRREGVKILEVKL